MPEFIRNIGRHISKKLMHKSINHPEISHFFEQTIPSDVINKLREYVQTQEKVSKELYPDEEYSPSILTDRDAIDLPNIDHRHVPEKNSHIDLWGSRVRLLKVKTDAGNELDIVLKKVHGIDKFHTAKDVVNEITNKVLKHNLLYRDKDYVLLAPEAYPIGSHYVAIRYYNYPEISEIYYGESRRALETYAYLEGNKLNESYYLAVKKLNSRFSLDEGNIMYLGFKNGKHVFMPLVDLV